MFASILCRSYLNPGEKILYVAHVHPFTIYKDFFKIVFFGLLIPLLFYKLMPPLAMIWGGWAMIGMIKLIFVFADWYYDALLITNQSLIDIEWKGIFKRSSTRTEYHTVNGFSYEMTGFWSTVLNYGNIQIEQIGTGNVLSLKNVINPKTTEREMLNAQSKYMRNKSFKDNQTLKDLLGNMLQDYSNFK